jgi:hypothetical protein
MKKNYDEEKRKVRKKGRIKKERKREKLEGNKKNKDAPRFFLVHKFSSALMINPYSNIPTMCNPITRTSLVPRDHPFATSTCPPI